MNIKNELIRIAKEIVSFEFPSKEALDEYLREHPNANPRHHWVKPTFPSQKRRDINDVFTNTSNMQKISDLVPTEFFGREIPPSKLQLGLSNFMIGGKRKPITVREKNGKLEIIDGNTTYHIFKALGYTEIPVEIDNSAKTLRELQRKAIKSGISLDEMKQVTSSGNKVGNSKKWLEKKLAEKAYTPIMKPEFENLPAKSSQPNVKTAEDFFKQAKESFGAMTELLDQGKGLDAKIGAKVILPNSGVNYKDFLNSSEPVIIVGSIKGQERASEKVNADYGGDWSKLKDGVRATVSVKSPVDIPKVFSQLESLGMKMAQKPKDRYASPTVCGYRDVLLSVQYPNGHIGEIQINCHDMILAKLEGHKIYEKARAVEAKAKEEGRDYMTDEELAIVADANKKMKKLYEEAFIKSSKELI